MTNRHVNDEQALIDLALGRCHAEQKHALEARLAAEEALDEHYRDVRATLDAVGLLPEVEPPAGLVARTMQRIGQKQQTDALLAREGLSAPVRRPTFSLRELAAMGAVAALLACVLLPAVRRASQVAAAGQCRARAGQIGSAMTDYANNNNDRLPAAGSQQRWLDASDQGGTSAGLFKLVAAGYAPPAVFRCPAGSGPGDPNFEVRAGMVDFPSPEAVGYSYQHTFGANELRRSDPAVATVATSMAILADQSPVFDEPQPRAPAHPNADANSHNHGQTGQNVLYLDMHVDWVRTPDAGVMGDNIYLAKGVKTYNGDERPTGPTDTFLLPAYTKP